MLFHPIDWERIRIFGKITAKFSKQFFHGRTDSEDLHGFEKHMGLSEPGAFLKSIVCDLCRR